MASPSTTGSPAASKAACSRCHDKKIKCDGRSPRCSACEKLDVACTPSTSFGSGKHDLSYINVLQGRVQTLQAREAELKRLIAQAKSSAPQPRPLLQNDQTRHVHDHGMGFVDLIFTRIRKEVIRASLESSQRVRRPLPAGSSGPPVSPAASAPPLMRPDFAVSLFDAYVRRSHGRHPFLPLPAIDELREKAVMAMTNGGQDWSAVEWFRVYTILAIGLVYRKQELSIEGPHVCLDADPLDIFHVAIRDIKNVNLSHGIEGVQNLLLLARFGFFYSIGISTWDISFVCLRICVECGFHRQPRSRTDPMEEQMQRRVFWQSYNLDRHSSATLGRPPSISDDAISVSLPANVDDVTLINAAVLFPDCSLNELLDKHMLMPGNQLTGMTLSISHIHLRRIDSDMFRSLRQLRHKVAGPSSMPTDLRLPSMSEVLDELVASEETWRLYYSYLDRLQQWRQTSKHYGLDEIMPKSPAEVLMQDTRWIDLHFYQEKLSLIRLTIEPGTGEGQTGSGLINATELLHELYDAASNIIVLYAQLVGDAKIEPTTGRLYRILTAGLSVLYTVITESHDLSSSQDSTGQIRRPTAPKSVSLPRSHQWFEARQGVLRLCTYTLDRMAKMVSAEQLRPKYVAYFELLCHEVLRHVSRIWDRSPDHTSRRPSVSKRGSEAAAVPETSAHDEASHRARPYDVATRPVSISRVEGEGPGEATTVMPDLNIPDISPATASEIMTIPPNLFPDLPLNQSLVPEHLAWPADLDTPLICQNPTLHLPTCCCGLWEIGDANDGAGGQWLANGIVAGGPDMLFMNGSDEQNLGMFFTEWEESSGMWQSLMRHNSDQVLGA